MSFQKLLIDKLGPHKVDEIQELILDSIFQTEKFTDDQRDTLAKYTALIHLTLNSIGLKSLENFPALSDAQIIELNNNKLTGEDLETMLKNCPSLYKIKLENNLIGSLDTLKCLVNYKIKKINLSGNPVVESNPNYRKELFETIPSLESIDGIDKAGEKVESTIYGGEEDDEEGEEGEDGSYNDDDGEEEYPEDEDDEGEDEDDDGEDEDDAPNKKSKE